MNEQRQELDERIADDERHAATMRKARDYDDLLARAEAAEARAAELEAALDAERDAHAWQPPSTVPSEQEVLLLVRGEVYGPRGHQWICTNNAPFDGWRPIPPLPQEPTP